MIDCIMRYNRGSFAVSVLCLYNLTYSYAFINYYLQYKNYFIPTSNNHCEINFDRSCTNDLQIMMEKTDSYEVTRYSECNLDKTARLDEKESQNESTSGSDDFFKYVHPSISNILNMRPEETCIASSQRYHWDESTIICPEKCCFNWDTLESFLERNSSIENFRGKKVISMDSLVVLASLCEEYIFNKHSTEAISSPPVKGLIKLAALGPLSKDGKVCKEKDSNILLATLVSLNMIESSIRDLVLKEHGRAPLLKDMIEMIDDRSTSSVLVPLLRSLLLPNVGINLRNLLWHGFLSCLHIRWLALSIVLILSIDDLSDASREDEINTSLSTLVSLKKLREHDSLAKILDDGHTILASQNGEIDILKAELLESQLVPKTHENLVNLLNQDMVQKYPVISSALMGLLIEHGLRLWWCDVNGMNDKIAKPDSYYVTLDGNSQRDKHDVILFPYLSNDSTNKLVHEIGGPIMALLSDTFTSRYGPNIRASIAHGLYNKYLYQELLNMLDEEQKVFVDCAHDAACINLFILKILATKKLGLDLSRDDQQEQVSGYKPVFSYSAVSARNIVSVMNSYYSLKNLISSEKMIYGMNSKISEQGEKVFRTLSIGDSYRLSLNLLLKCHILHTLSYQSNELWSHEDIFKDVNNNMVLSKCGASIILLNEIATGLDLYLMDLKEALLDTIERPLSSRRRKQICRMFSMASMTLSFYNICILCAMLQISKKLQSPDNQILPVSHQDFSDEILMHAVKRSRMVVSTFSTASNVDRAIKSVSEYLKGKSISVIMKCGNGKE